MIGGKQQPGDESAEADESAKPDNPAQSETAGPAEAEREAAPAGREPEPEPEAEAQAAGSPEPEGGLPNLTGALRGLLGGRGLPAVWRAVCHPGVYRLTVSLVLTFAVAAAAAAAGLDASRSAAAGAWAARVAARASGDSAAAAARGSGTGQSAPLPPATLVQQMAQTYTVPGTAPSLDWPSTGQGALAVEGLGTVGSTGDTGTPVPIASVTKTMTAYRVLLDHPLPAGTTGPLLTITQADYDLYQTEIAEGDSVVPVAVGEQLTERQALEALMLASADNIAVLLADWDDGSPAAFVAAMNSTAASLGMTHTHYADPAGLDPGSVSTAPDLILLAQAALLAPSFTGIVDEQSAQLPVGGPIQNFNTLLGQEGIVGVKTGSTSAAGACLLFAAQISVGGQPVTLVGALLGQPLLSGRDFLSSVLGSVDTIVGQTEDALTTATVAAPGTAVAEVTRRGYRDQTYGVTAPVTVVGWPGLTFTVQVYGNTGSAGLLATVAGGTQAEAGASLAALTSVRRETKVGA